MTSRGVWIAVVAALLLAGVLWLVLERPRSPLPDRGPRHCSDVMLCDVAAPPPVDLDLADRPLSDRDPDRHLIDSVAGTRGRARIYPLVPNESALGSRLFFIDGGSGQGSLVIVRQDGISRVAYRIRERVDLSRQFIRTDADLSLRRFALLDRATNLGDTFQLDWAPDPDAPYRIVAPDSPAIRAQWLATRNSSCGGGPLTAVPRAWIEAYEAECAAHLEGRRRTGG